MYADLSSRIMSILREEVGVVNIYSIDEAFFQMELSSDEALRFSNYLKEKIFNLGYSTQKDYHLE